MAAALPPLSRWALDDARTPDERYALLLLADACRHLHWVSLPPAQRVPGRQDMVMDYKGMRAAQLRPLDLPPLRPVDLELLEQMAPVLRVFAPMLSCEARYLGEMGAALRFFPALETVGLGWTSLSDLSFVEALPRLRSLSLAGGELEDLGPLARCPSLRHLGLSLTGIGSPLFAPPVNWLDARPLAALTELETLSLAPNPAVLAGLRFPKLHTVVLTGTNCVQADCAHLPEMPALRFLTLSGVQSLRGIQRFPELRHLKVEGPLRDFGDLPLLTKLDCLEVATQWGWPRRVEPVAALPELLWVRFTGEHPRNYWPLTGAPKLRELELAGCKLADLDKEAVNAVLPPWDEVFGLEEPRALPSFRFVAVEHGGDKRALPPTWEEPHPDYVTHPKLFHLEVRWMFHRIKKAAARFLEDEDAVTSLYYPSEGSTQHREVRFQVETMAAALRLPELLEVMRQELAWSPHREWRIHIHVGLRIRLNEMSEQQKKWLRMIEEDSNEWEDEAHMERWRARQGHILETSFRLREMKEEGEEPDPEDFEPPEILRDEADGARRLVAAGPAAPGPSAEDEDDEDEDEAESRADFELKPFDEQEKNAPGDEGGDDDETVAVAPPPEPPDSFVEDPYAHPLAEYYRQYLTMTEDALFYTGMCDLPALIQLMRREPDEFYPAPPKQEGAG